MGRQIGLKNVGAFWGNLSQTTVPILIPLFMVLSMYLVVLFKKKLDFSPKTYKFQINPKYDIVCEEFGRLPSHVHRRCVKWILNDSMR